jgi:hypothetical protein
MEKQTNLANRLRVASNLIPSATVQGLLLEAAATLEENARIIELASHTECPANLGLGGTLAWHREKIKQLRQRPQL